MKYWLCVRVEIFCKEYGCLAEEFEPQRCETQPLIGWPGSLRKYSDFHDSRIGDFAQRGIPVAGEEQLYSEKLEWHVESIEQYM